MPVVQQGSINTTALIVPDLYVQIVPPQVQLLNGVPTNIAGIVGTAQWGPVNSPVIMGSMADYALNFGSIQNRKYDMGTIMATAVLQGASNFRGVRVTDGTDVAASIIILSTCLTLTAKYTGTLGNGLVASTAPGSAASTSRITIGMPGQVPEVFDNIPGTGNALWVNMAAAINNGTNGLRGASRYVVASAGAGVAALVTASYALAGGTDGAGIAATNLVGADTGTRTGMYALRGTGTSIAALADCDTSTTWTTQVSFGFSEGIYMIGVGPAGDTISNATTVKATAGIDAYPFKLLQGDWILWADPVAQLTRLVSPQGFALGRLANLSPEQSSLNKPLFGIVGTQRSQLTQLYGSAELQALGQAGIDLICNPIPAGNVFGARFGHNSSSNPVINGDNYTRMTNYLAYTFNAGMGLYIGQLQSIQPNDPLRRKVAATLSAFLQAMKDQGQIDDFSVICDTSNNKPDRIALGYLQADVKVRYLAVVEKFIINLEGGQSVTVARQQTSAAA
ncbi:phage tail sheath C-terminal domain-containing protein [Variovorax sp. GB1P17]|uniref:phage tail sheath C-terminal domain-containing protein n=1 Tax=Variovorax sp. GB1P17 TaxID=3443740 RepID=UPI003F463ACB